MITIAVDFDGTIVEHMFPNIGAPIPGAKTVLEVADSVGIEIILWTCREGQHLEDAVEYCKSKKIPITSVNRNTENLISYAARKIVATMYIDDRGFWPGHRPGTDLTLEDWSLVGRQIDDLVKIDKERYG